jgi:hypothetical protein
MSAYTIKAIKGQSLIDIALQEYGSCDAAHQVGIMNGLSVTDEPVENSLINMDSDLVVDLDIVVRLRAEASVLINL